MVAKVKCTHNISPCTACDEIRKERKRETCRKWRAQNPDKIKSLSKEYTLKNDTTPKYRFNKAKQKSKKRGIEFTIVLEEYSAAISQPCYYCNNALGQVTKGTGLDRLDSDKGYIAGNIVSCCATCNLIKNDKLTVEETKIAVSAVLAYRANLKSSQAPTQS